MENTNAKSQMAQLLRLALTNSVEYAYIAHIEELVLDHKSFDADRCAEDIFNAAMARYEKRLRARVHAILGGDDAV